MNNEFIKNNDNNIDKMNNELIMNRDNEIKKIHNDLVTINNIYKELSTIIDNDKIKVETIYQNTDKTHALANEGLDNINKLKLNKKNNCVLS